MDGGLVFSLSLELYKKSGMEGLDFFLYYHLSCTRRGGAIVCLVDFGWLKPFLLDGFPFFD